MRGELMGSEVERDIHAAFESVRARHSEALIAAEAGRDAGDWETSKANKDAFLVVEHRRRRLAARIHRPDRLRRGRYRDLLLITNLISIEYELLTDRGDRSVSVSPQEKPQLSGLHLPADWAQPWGVTAMFELRAAFGGYCVRRDRLARRLSSRSRERAAAEADQELDRICDLTTLRRGPDEGRTKPAPIDRGPVAQRWHRVRTSKRARSPRRGRLLIGAAAIAASTLAIAGAYVALGEDGASSSAPPVRAGVPERPLPVLGYGSESKPARDRKRAEPEPAPEPKREPSSATAEGTAPTQPEKVATSFSAQPVDTPAPVRDAAPPPKPKPKPKPPKSSSPPKPKPPKSGPAPGPAPAPAPLPAPAPAPAPDPPTG
ncbi:MAG: hypothetical protein ACRDKV_02710 [Solirubrobacterales bacterium]